MIKTALKHWIYEFCIDQIFNGIVKNFPTKKPRFVAGEEIDTLYVYKYGLNMFYKYIFVTVVDYDDVFLNLNCLAYAMFTEINHCEMYDEKAEIVNIKGKTYWRRIYKNHKTTAVVQVVQKNDIVVKI